ncbi:MAG: hypothetical protein RLZZ303_291 [Candidatus Hydrogenedentota bacterium]|jgi:hypothetical protein
MSNDLKALLTVAGLSLALSVIAFAGMFLWFQSGAPLVAAQDNTVGEMLLDEALRFDTAGAEYACNQKLRLAAKARFEGTKNLRHLQFELGSRDIEADYVIAEEQLKRATQDFALLDKDPALWVQAWASLDEALLVERGKQVIEVEAGGDLELRRKLQRGFMAVPSAAYRLEVLREAVRRGIPYGQALTEREERDGPFRIYLNDWPSRYSGFGATVDSALLSEAAGSGSASGSTRNR